MSVRYEKLFEVHFEHQFFTDLRFTGFNLFPVPETRSLFLQYGLVLKLQAGSCIILFANPFEGSLRDRASVLKEGMILRFNFQVSDSSFYGYTGNLPDGFINRTFMFSNFDDKQQVIRKTNLLHLGDFVSESEMKQSAKSFNGDGCLEIHFDDDLQEDLYIRFLNRSMHWRYIIVSDHLQQSGNLAIVNMENKKLFSGPETVTLPDGSKAISFLAQEPIAITQKAGRHFQLVADYDETTKHFDRVLIAQLPAPSLSSGSKDNEIIIYL
jgi:hypothetical protein